MRTLLLAIIALRHSTAIPIPNGQIGNAEVDCQENKIEIVFATEEDFLGRVFVLGHADNPQCRSEERGGRTTSISIPLDECGSVKTRSIDPPGLFISTKVMLSFHSQFVTKVDRGYDIQCFYMQADKTVTYPLMVSMNPVEPFSAVAEMPRCRYEVIDPHKKEPIEVATVGQQLLHTWTCESSSPDLWCMRVHSCFVEDDNDVRVTVLSDDGCAIDRYLLDNLEYGPGNLRAQKEAHAFKFAEDVVVNFQCSIRLDIRTEEECEVPTCPDISGKRRRRSHEEEERSKSKTEEEERGLTVDVRAPTMQVLELGRDFSMVGALPCQECYSMDMVLWPLSILTGIVLFLFGALIRLMMRK
ncbi:hypothetical protein PENTCL1PPCAC_30689 [Pristionchus entomophagus]|uniref:ZP domain-containing protein n=2 Tax=Pristionchus entomophagus TaxID=358040 RepID=A0AAV5UQK1_9BILA|nr:hypothetical protein PENTCL1PPCAC_30689 [Pristionchus entomophagus]